MKKLIEDYVYHTTFDESISDITDKIFDTNVEWHNHSWADNYGKHIREYNDGIEVVWQNDVGIGMELCENLKKYIKEYDKNIIDEVLVDEIHNISPIRFNRYSKNVKMEYHFDHIRTLFDGKQKGIPILSIVGLLNDDFSGGEFVINEKIIPLKKNSLLIFPSNFLYLHGVNPINDGVRYSFVSWIW